VLSERRHAGCCERNHLKGHHLRARRRAASTALGPWRAGCVVNRGVGSADQRRGQVVPRSRTRDDVHRDDNPRVHDPALLPRAPRAQGRASSELPPGDAATPPPPPPIDDRAPGCAANGAGRVHDARGRSGAGRLRGLVSASQSALRTVTWSALGTTAVLEVTARGAAAARAAAEREITAMDLAASRFREDSELATVNREAGHRVAISHRLFEALSVALEAARTSDGAVDPTLGQDLIDRGYDRDFAQLDRVEDGSPVRAVTVTALRVPAWPSIELWEDPPAVRIPAGVRLDLGATAKALAADRGAQAAQRATGLGVILSLGGDLATAGPAPAGGWAVRVTDDHRDTSGHGQTITIASGGVATSSLVTRRWRHQGQTQHHILDPLTGAPVTGRWRTASVAASSCTGANIASSAALVLGDDAPDWLAELGLPARLTAIDGSVHIQGGWPE
jgi:thiamine biosynthesis lipoprotein